MTTPVVSADSHIVEPPNCYIDYIDPKYRDIAPRIGPMSDGGDGFFVDGIRKPIALGLMSAAGVDSKIMPGVAPKFTVADLHRGGWDPNARMADLKRDGVDAEIIYASVGMVLCNHKNPDYKDACFRAYNRWLAEFCAQQPKALFGLGQTAVRSVDEAIDDFRKIKAAGFVGVMMPGCPIQEDYDHPMYDALWECATDLDLPLCFHILTSRQSAAQLTEVRGNKLNGFMGLIRGIQDMIGLFTLGGVFERHPKLKMVVAEGDAGWVPHYMYRADHAAERLGTGTDRFISKKPSEYVRNNIWFTFQDDATAYQTEALVGDKALVDGHNLIWASDYPHTDSTYPRSRQVRETQMAKLNETQKNNIIHDNVRNLFNLPVQ